MRLAIWWVALVLACSSRGQSQTPDGAPQPLGTLVDVGGYRVHLYCTGIGSPTVIVTGAGASFDWGLVQPEVAKFTRVCTYDHSGAAWSDPGPQDTCRLRVNEIHAALKNSGIAGPYVLVGHSLGALVSRLYAVKFEQEVAGVVIVDHASMKPVMFPAGRAGSAPSPRLPMKQLDPNGGFEKLPEHYYKLHLWASSLPASAGVMSRNVRMLSECDADVSTATQNRTAPLGSKPFIALSTQASEELHKDLLKLSTSSKQVTAENSGHYIMIDRPDAVIAAIRDVVEAARTHVALKK